jgi:hypothetical protein
MSLGNAGFRSVPLPVECLSHTSLLTRHAIRDGGRDSGGRTFSTVSRSIRIGGLLELPGEFSGNL